ncbi:hypothetical protein [Streptomyces albipurpureus]|uniref:Tyr recombinase domain-containing protein n=1 Tax=Streptomyces albipurpureus TaxID=2897419 RepID=A0ABT0UVH7_9ACTN|nr:hypothetical protein [Streptomyces sp. CWNU-1]MCM2392578.1 hypothetical protein [Streptomyces sp. CWNU-1]
MTNAPHRHSTYCGPGRLAPCDDAHDAYRQLAAWTAEGSPYKLASGGFSAEARRHYRAYTTAWLNWCDLGDGLDPYACARAKIGVWISDEHESAALATRAVMVSAVTSFYQHLLALAVADGVDTELTRARLAGAPVPADPKRTGLRGDGPRWMMDAADRLTGRDALRDRALIYLLLNSYFGHEKLRPGTILALDLEDRVNEGFRISWKVRPKNAEDSALTAVTVNRDAALALDAYAGWTVAGTYEPDPLTGRVISAAHGTYLSRGALLTGSSNRARGARLVGRR